METRLLIAYALIGVVVVVGAAWYTRATMRRRARARRMRGIKVEQKQTRERGSTLAR